MILTFNQAEIEVYIDSETGETFTSISGYARMSGLSKQAISQRVNRLLKGSTKEASDDTQSLAIKDFKGYNQTAYFRQLVVTTKGGDQTITVLTEDFIAYWIPRDNPQLAVQFVKLGVRKFQHELIGYKHAKEIAGKQEALIDYLSDRARDHFKRYLFVLKEYDQLFNHYYELKHNLPVSKPYRICADMLKHLSFILPKSE